MRLSADGERQVVCIANLVAGPARGLSRRLAGGRRLEELVNTDSTYYGGSGIGNMGKVTAEPRAWHEQPFSAELTLPPLGVLWLPAVLVVLRRPEALAKRLRRLVRRDQRLGDILPLLAELLVRLLERVAERGRAGLRGTYRL